MARAFDVYVGGDLYDASEKVFTPVVDGADFLAIPRVDADFTTRNWLNGQEESVLTGQPTYDAAYAILQNGLHYLQTELDNIAEQTVLMVCRRSVTTNTTSQHTGWYSHLTAPALADGGTSLSGPHIRSFDTTTVRAKAYFGATPATAVLDQRGLTVDYSQWRLFVHRIATGRHRFEDLVSGLSSENTPSGPHTLVTSKASIGRGFDAGGTAGSAYTAWFQRYPSWLTDVEVAALAEQIVAELALRGLTLTLA